jgi:hypothetical protein
MDKVIVIDDVLPNFVFLKDNVMHLRFEDAFSQGRLYADISMDLSAEEIYESIAPQLGFRPLNVLSFLRAYRDRNDLGRMTWIHSDKAFSDYIGVFFIQPSKYPMDDGFCLWKNKELNDIELKPEDFESDAAYKADMSTLTPEDWELWKRIEFKPNRLVICPASYFHSTATYKSHGRTIADARIVQVLFFNKGPDNV